MDILTCLREMFILTTQGQIMPGAIGDADIPLWQTVILDISSCAARNILIYAHPCALEHGWLYERYQEAELHLKNLDTEQNALHWPHHKPHILPLEVEKITHFNSSGLIFPNLVFKFNLFIFNWRIIALQWFSFCHTSTWITCGGSGLVAKLCLTF